MAGHLEVHLGTSRGSMGLKASFHELLISKAMGRKGCGRENDVSSGLALENTRFLTTRVASCAKLADVVDGESNGCPFP